MTSIDPKKVYWYPIRTCKDLTQLRRFLQNSMPLTLSYIDETEYNHHDNDTPPEDNDTLPKLNTAVLMDALRFTPADDQLKAVLEAMRNETHCEIGYRFQGHKCEDEVGICIQMVAKIGDEERDLCSITTRLEWDTDGRVLAREVDGSLK